jgi:hypothetical protein
MPVSLPPFVIRALKIAAYLLPVALIVHAVTFWRHGIIDIEAMQFVLNYLQKRPFFAQIFDPQINDWGWYQAREFSYLFDFIDARVFAALLDRHILLFAPLSGTVGLVVFSAAFVCGARRVLRLEHVTISLALSLFLSCIVIQASTAIFYRSSKIILSIILLGFLFSLVSLMHQADANSPIKLPKLVTFYFSGALMSMCDRQGFFYLGAGTAIVSILWLLRIIQRRPAWPNHFYIILAALGAIVTATLYNHVLAPWVIYLLNGYWPRFDFQHLTKAQLINPGLVAPAWQMFREQVRFFFGNIPFAALCIISAIALLAKMGKSLFRIPIVARFKQILKDDLVITTVASVVAINLLLLVMIARHPPVYSVPDHSFWYYPFTVHVILLFGISSIVPRSTN